MIETWIFAWRRSGLTSTCVTVTFFTRGSFSSIRMEVLTCSRTASATLAVRRDVMLLRSTGPGLIERPLDLVDAEGFEQVPLFHVVEPVEPDAAFHAVANFA